MLLNTDRETSSFASAVTPLAILGTKLFVWFPPRAMISSHFFFTDGWFGFNNKRFITTISFSIICRFGLHVFVGFLQMDSSKRYSYNGRWSRCFWWIKIEFYDGFFSTRTCSNLMHMSVFRTTVIRNRNLKFVVVVFLKSSPHLASDFFSLFLVQNFFGLVLTPLNECSIDNFLFLESNVSNSVMLFQTCISILIMRKQTAICSE